MSVILPAQTMIDKAMQDLGDASRCLEMALLNNVCLTDDITVGSELLTPAIDTTKQNIITILNRIGLAPASKNYSTQLPGGIGYWYIQQDFIIS